MGGVVGGVGMAGEGGWREEAEEEEGEARGGAARRPAGMRGGQKRSHFAAQIKAWNGRRSTESRAGEGRGWDTSGANLLVGAIAGAAASAAERKALFTYSWGGRTLSATAHDSGTEMKEAWTRSSQGARMPAGKRDPFHFLVQESGPMLFLHSTTRVRSAQQCCGAGASQASHLT